MQRIQKAIIPIAGYGTRLFPATKAVPKALFPIIAHNGRFLIGMIDNVRIYDRILDEKEVQQNFESKSDQLPVEPAGKLSATWGYLKALRN
jgi:hypothetical protein